MFCSYRLSKRLCSECVGLGFPQLSAVRFRFARLSDRLFLEFLAIQNILAVVFPSAGRRETWLKQTDAVDVAIMAAKPARDGTA